MRFSESWPIAPMLPTTIEVDGQHRQRDVPVILRRQQRDVEEAQQDRERRRLGRDRHEGGDRRRRALVDVGRPLVEGRHRGLEGEAGERERDAGQQQRVAGDAVAPRSPRAIVAKSVEPRRAVDRTPARTAASPSPTEPITRYLSPDSSDVAPCAGRARTSRTAGSTAARCPRKSVTRLVAPASTTMP